MYEPSCRFRPPYPFNAKCKLYRTPFTDPFMSWKSVWPIIAGFLMLAVLSVGADMILRGFFPKAFGLSEAPLGVLASAVTLFYASAFGVLSSYLTATLAPSRPVLHALALGSIAF